MMGALRWGRLGLGLALFVVSAQAAAAQSCALPLGPSARLQSLARVSDYAPQFESCRNQQGQSAVAIRSMRIGGAPYLLLADSAALSTQLAPAACWSCAQASEAELSQTRMVRAIAQSAQATGLAHRGFLENAGLAHGAGAGAFVTGDLCPSPRPLDRKFFVSLAATAPGAPVALSISGLWLTHHFDDFQWLLARQNSGDLNILWVDHSYHHPYARDRPDAQTYLMSPGVNVDAELLDTERLLIANGQTPSLFFRFPGLASTSPLMQAVRRLHLIALGADAWLAIGQKPGPGSIILVHPNGNEPVGLRLFDRDLQRGLVAQPLQSLNAAPE